MNSDEEYLPPRQSMVLNWLSSSLKSCAAWLACQIIPILILFFVLASILLFVVFSTLSSTLTESIVLQEAKRYSQALAEFRSLYTSEVVSRVAPHGVTVTHDYTTKEGAIPLPATFSILLGARLGELSEGTEVRLFSNYPFPWRADGGPRDTFEREALDHILADPTRPFYRIESLQGQDVLRYATGDLMREACVNCHNTHPDSPKKDWKAGDVRGILEVIQPLGHAIVQTRENLQGLLVVILTLIGIGIGIVALVIMSLRRNAIELEQRVQHRTSNLKEVNQKLENSVQDQQRTEQELRQAFSEIQNLVSSISLILIQIDNEGQILQWNKAAEQTFNIPASTVINGYISDLPNELWDWPEIMRGISIWDEEGIPCTLNEVFFRQPSGKEGILRFRFNPLFSDTGTPAGLLMLGEDITERKHLETQLGQAQKMESIGQLAAGIAHEINTPTQFVSDNLRFLTESFADIQKVLEVYEQVFIALPRETVDPQLLKSLDATVAEADLEYVSEEVPKALKQSLEGSERVGRIVRAMKEFSHPGTVEKKPIDLNHAIESTITVARNEWKYVAEVVTDLDPTLPPVPCLPGEFNQVILNLLINAAHAIEAAIEPESGRTGRITVSTRLVREEVEVRITDTGTGIPETAQKKIFDPFFTTKEVGKGTGQGLAIAHDVIVNKHGGRLTFETMVGTGTTFIIQLPCPSTAMLGG